MYPNISKQFLFVTDGYNFRNDELSAVLGLSQLNRLDSINEKNKNYSMFISLMEKYPNLFYVPKYHEGVSNFASQFILCKVDRSSILYG